MPWAKGEKFCITSPQDTIATAFVCCCSRSN